MLVCRENLEGLSKVPLRVLMSKEELESLLRSLHDNLGHFSFQTIWSWIKVRFWRPHLFAEVKHFVFSCVQCQRFLMVKPQYSFDGRSSISGLFHCWQLDYLGPFPVSENGNRYVLSFVEVLSGYP
ncbi:hypothetical protein O9G_005452, partial [Rozella allomycis CSF55]